MAVFPGTALLNFGTETTYLSGSWDVPGSHHKASACAIPAVSSAQPPPFHLCYL